MNLTGLIAAPHTPFDENLQLDLETVPKLLERYAAHQLAGAFVCGSTGECASLTVAERRRLAEAWVSAAAASRVQVIVHCGSCCQTDSIELAANAQLAGADAVAAFAPHYFVPESVESLIEFLKPIAGAADELPFYFYDIPLLTGVELPMVEFLDRGQSEIPNLAGLKYTNGDLVQLQECIQRFGNDYNILFGCDEMLLAGLSLGVHGAVGSTYNFAAPLYHDIIEAFGRGDMDHARRQQARSVEMINAIAFRGFLSSAKAVMKMIGIDCGQPRPPMQAMSATAAGDLHEELEQIGLFEWQELPTP